MMGINDAVDTDAYEDVFSKKTELFFKSFRVYKLGELLKLHMASKIEENKLQNYRNKLLERENQIKKSIESNPKNSNDYVKLAQYYRGRGKYQAEEKMLKKAIENEPIRSETFVQLANNYWHQGKLKDVEVMFKRALEINPVNSIALEEMVEYYKYIGDWETSKKFLKNTERILKEVIAVKPENDEAYVGLAHYYWEGEDLDLVEEMYKKALKLNPYNSEACENLSDLYKNAELISQKAIKVLEGCISMNIARPYLDSKSIYMYKELAGYYRLEGDLNRAEETLKKAMALNPASDDVYYELLALHHQKQTINEGVRNHSKENNETKIGWYEHITVFNYNILKENIIRKGIKLVSMQYPMRSVKPLKKIFNNSKGIAFVDNEQIFKEAVKRGNYDKLFIDNFGGDFGHCTFEGERLVAENAARVILKEYF